MSLPDQIDAAQRRAAELATLAVRLQQEAAESLRASETLMHEADQLKQGQDKFVVKIQARWRGRVVLVAFVMAKRAAMKWQALTRRRALWRRVRHRWAVRSVQSAARRRALLLKGRTDRLLLRRATDSLSFILNARAWVRLTRQYAEASAALRVQCAVRRRAATLDLHSRRLIAQKQRATLKVQCAARRRAAQRVAGRLRERRRRLQRRIEVWRRHGASTPQLQQPRWRNPHPVPSPSMTRSPSAACKGSAVARGFSPSGSRPIDHGYVGLASSRPIHRHYPNGTPTHALAVQPSPRRNAAGGNEGQQRLNLFVSPPQPPPQPRLQLPPQSPPQPPQQLQLMQQPSPRRAAPPQAPPARAQHKPSSNAGVVAAGHSYWCSKRAPSVASPAGGGALRDDGKLAQARKLAGKGSRPHEQAAFGPHTFGHQGRE